MDLSPWLSYHDDENEDSPMLANNDFDSNNLTSGLPDENCVWQDQASDLMDDHSKEPTSLYEQKSGSLERVQSKFVRVLQPKEDIHFYAAASQAGFNAETPNHLRLSVDQPDNSSYESLHFEPME